MKNNIFFNAILFFVFCFGSLNAQIKVTSNGNVGIKTTNPQAHLDIGNTNSNEIKAILARLPEGTNSWLSVNSYTTQTNSKMFAIEHKFYNTLNNSINFYRGGSTIGGYISFNVYDNREIAKFYKDGLEVNGNISAGIDSPELIGTGNKLLFLGKSRNADPLWIARYNKATEQSELRVNIGDDGGANDKFSVGYTSWSDDIWHEHFAVRANGDVLVTNGTINGVPISSSDIRYKENITSLEPEESLHKLLRLNPIEYNMKQRYSEQEVNGEKRMVPLYTEDSQVFKKKHLGLVAQELQELYPDLVYSDSLGYLAVNYVELIPVLIQSIQTLNRKIENLENTNASLRSENSTADISTVVIQGSKLYQNAPNPFSERTAIYYELSESIKTADIYIFNMQGSIVKKIAANRSGSIEIQGSELQAGMYLYSLVADGKEVDTKRMILTK